jgi:uncharacterized membrane protein
MAAKKVFTLGAGIHQLVYFIGCTIEDSNAIATALHIQSQILSHYRKADQAEIAQFAH